MKNYPDLTHGLQAALLHVTRGYTLTTQLPIVVNLDKVSAIEAKFIETYGTNLPSWKRYDRKSKKLPNAVGVVVPVLGDPYQRQAILLCTPFDENYLRSLSDRNPFLHETWKPQIRVGDFEIVREVRDRGDHALTWKLTKSAYIGLDNLLRNRQRNGDWFMVIEELKHAVRLYPMFGGVRRQLRRLIASYKKLYEKKVKKEWTGPDPDNLPRMVGFRSSRRAISPPATQSSSTQDGVAST